MQKKHRDSSRLKIRDQFSKHSSLVQNEEESKQKFFDRTNIETQNHAHLATNVDYIDQDPSTPVQLDANLFQRIEYSDNSMNATPDRIVNETSSSGPKPPSYGAPSKHAQRKGSHLLMAKRGKGSMTIQSVNTHAVP